MKPRILVVMDGLKIGGVESALLAVLRRLDQLGYSMDLLLLHEHEELLDKVPNEVNILRYWQMTGGKRTAMFYLWYTGMQFSRLLHQKTVAAMFQQKIAYVLNRNKVKMNNIAEYDAVVAFKQGEAENFVVRYMDGPKKILCYHHGSIQDDALHRRTFPYFDRIVAVSEGVRKLLAEQYPLCAEKLLVIPNYIEPQRIRNKAKAFSVPCDAERLNICTVSRLSQEKRFDLLLEAATVLKEIYYVPFHLRIIGNGDLYAELENQISEKGLDQEVSLLGAMTNPLPYVAASDIYVQTSQMESFGLSMLEALVLGKPVVSTKTIGGQLLVKDGENGVLVDWDSDSIAKGILVAKDIYFDSDDSMAAFLQKDMECDRLWDALLMEK